MEALARWLSRLESPDPDSLSPYFLRLISPGFDGLELDNFVIAATEVGALERGSLSSSPEVLSRIILLDTSEGSASLTEQQRRTSELAALISLALDRRIDMPPEISVKSPAGDQIVFMPYQQAMDRSLLGPMPEDALERVSDHLSCVSGLAQSDLESIGAATSLHHGAILIFDRDLGAAYALLVAGIEVLSRAYGSPPTEWEEYENAESWEAFFEENELSPAQRGAVRQRLMKDRHLRLKATFRKYASERLPDEFWEKPWQEWMYGFFLNEGRWTTATGPGERTIRDVLSEDRVALSKSLGFSYDLRSGIVHRGKGLTLLDLITPPEDWVPSQTALPFSVLRAILGQLIRLELNERGTDRQLPDVQVMNEPE